MKGIFKKWWFWLIAVIVVIAAVMMLKKSGSLGSTSSGKNYTEADILKEMNIIKGISSWWEATKAKAQASGKSESEQLRADAIWMLENAPGH